MAVPVKQQSHQTGLGDNIHTTLTKEKHILSMKKSTSKAHKHIEKDLFCLLPKRWTDVPTSSLARQRFKLGTWQQAWSLRMSGEGSDPNQVEKDFDLSDLPERFWLVLNVHTLYHSTKRDTPFMSWCESWWTNWRTDKGYENTPSAWKAKRYKQYILSNLHTQWRQDMEMLSALLENWSSTVWWTQLLGRPSRASRSCSRMCLSELAKFRSDTKCQ